MKLFRINTILFVILLWANISFAQAIDNIYERQSLIAAPEGNILYRGLKNPISAVTTDYKDITLSASEGASVTKGKISKNNGEYYDGEYIVTIEDLSIHEVTITISSDGKNIGNQKFKVMNTPTPVITIDHQYRNGYYIPKSAIKTNSKLDAVIENCYFPYDLKYTVTSFSYITEIRGVTKKIYVEGNIIPNDILDDISKKAAGSVITFVDIEVSTPSGTINAGGFVATLK